MSLLFAKDDDRCFPSKSNKSLGIDEACLSINNELNWPISLYSRFNNCHECDDILWKNINNNTNTTLVLSTKYPQHLNYKILGVNESNSCQTTTYNFIEHGHYGWNISLNKNCSNIYEIIEPNNPYLPLIGAFVILIIATLIFSTTNFIINVVKNITKVRNNELMNETQDQNQQQQQQQQHQHNENNGDDDDNHSNLSFDQQQNRDDILTETRSASTAIIQQSQRNYPPITSSSSISLPSSTIIKITKSSTRLQSIDAFRGICILLMIFVNNGGGKYVLFNHSPWYGLTIADFVLPWFLWIMGMTIVLSLRSQLRLSISKKRIIFKSLKRTLILIIFGIIINSLSSKNNNKKHLENLRFLGVLQLFGITSLISICIEMIGIKTLRNFQYRSRFYYLQDILDAWRQWFIIIIIIGIHTSIIFLLNIPGCPKGYFGPGGYDNHGKYNNCTGGAAGYIDRLILNNHIYMKLNNIIYGETNSYDPEGLMNTLSSLITVQFGIHAGRILFCYYLHNISKILRWFMWSIIIGIIGYLLCNGDINNNYNNSLIPVSKNLMTLSFILLTCSCAFLLFSIIYYLIDHRRLWNGAPFIYPGRNSIFLYIAHYFTMNCFPWSWQIDNPTHAKLLSMNIWTTIIWTFISYIMNKKDIIITV